MQSIKWVRLISIVVVLMLSGCWDEGSDNPGSKVPNAENKAPIVTISSPVDGNIFPQNTSISFVGTGSDEEDGGLNGSSLVWSSNLGGELGSGTTISTLLAIGSHTITLRGTDNDGDSGSKIINIIVNAAPQINSFNVTPNTQKKGDFVAFSWDVSDADGDTLICNLDIDADGTDDYIINDCVNNTSQEHTYMQTGIYQANLSVFDGINTLIQRSVTVSVDITAPTIPTNLSSTAFSSSQIDLSWSASTDAVGVTGYRIYRDSNQISTTTNTSYSDTGLTAETVYSYRVSAYDAVGNVSELSMNTSATTGTFSASTASPVLNFSDITSGPKTGLNDGKGSGAIVTIWGQNLGDMQGDSKIYIGNQEAAYVYYWGRADGSKQSGPAKLYTYQKMQTISFSIPATVSDGLNNIYVEVNGQNSEALQFVVRSGDIYFVKQSGINGSTIDGTWDDPWATLDYVALGSNNLGAGGRFKPGDIVYATDGVIETDGLYVKYIHGTAQLPLSVIAYPGAEVLIEDAGYRGIHNWNGKASYWNFSKLIIKTNGNGINGFKGMRAISNEITNYPNGCADGQGGAIAGSNLNGPNFAGGGIKMLGNYVHNFGCDTTSKLHHVFYISNRGGTMIESYEIGWNHVSDTKVHHALHVYDEGPCGGFSGTMRIHDNVVINQVGHGINISAGGSSKICYNMPIEIYNNLIVNSGLEIPTSAGHTRAIAITSNKNQSDIKLYNNTFYGYGESGDGHAIRVQATGSPAWVFGGTWEFINNIFVDTNNLPFEIPQYWGAPDVGHNNLWYSSSAQALPSWNMNSISTNPQFVNPVIGGSFMIDENSPANNAGANTSAVVKRDITGTLRGATGSISIGAYEYTE